MHFVVGTAGHIDHGKSALVRALTGTDPDRLKEEKERGMTTDLGFAFLGEDITIIDVPGHEKFVRHMLAGASTVDMVMLVVAADDGVMPQTVEHLDICRLMGIRHGLVVINKVDLVERDWLELVREDVARLVAGTFLEGAPVLAVSSTTGAGIPELRAAIDRLVADTPRKPDRGVFRMPVDRSFTIKGFGTVVAGTVLSGRCRVGDKLELLPEGREVRVRGIQRHNDAIEETVLGDRAALNLQGLERDAVERGNLLATPGYYSATQVLNGTLYLLKGAERPLRNMSRVRLHVGTAEVMARAVLLDRRELAPGEEGLVQLRTEAPVVCDWNDHYVIRSYSPQRTIGGGIVLEPVTGKERRFEETLVARLNALKRGDTMTVLEQHLLKKGFEAVPEPALAQELALTAGETTRLVERLVADGQVRRLEHEGHDYLVHARSYERARDALVAALTEFHARNPVKLGLKGPELRAKAGTGLSVPLYQAVLGELIGQGLVVRENLRLRLESHHIRLKPEEQKLFDRVSASMAEAGFQPPALDEALAGADARLADRVRTALFESGTLVDVGEGVVFPEATLEQVRERVRALLASRAEMTASEFRQELGTTRRYAIPLLNYLDSTGLTQRRGDKRVLRQAQEPPARPTDG